MAGSGVQPGDGLRLGVVPDVPAVLVLLVDPFHGVGKGEQGRVNVKVGVPNGALYLYALGNGGEVRFGQAVLDQIDRLLHLEGLEVFVVHRRAAARNGLQHNGARRGRQGKPRRAGQDGEEGVVQENGGQEGVQDCAEEAHRFDALVDRFNVDTTPRKWSSTLWETTVGQKAGTT